MDKLSNVEAVYKTVLSNLATMRPFMCEAGQEDDLGLDDEQKRNLVTICTEALRRGTHPSTKMKQNLKRLPIFERRDEDGFLALREPTQAILFSPTLDEKVPRDFLTFISKHAVVLKYRFPEFLRCLGVEELSAATLVEKFVDGYMNSRDVAELAEEKRCDDLPCYAFQKEMISYLATNWEALSTRNHELEKLLSSTPLIPVRDDSSDDNVLLTAPDQLYYPNIALFERLFRDDPVFPHAFFLRGANKTYLEWLRQLGMKHKINSDVCTKARSTGLCDVYISNLCDGFDRPSLPARTRSPRSRTKRKRCRSRKR